MSKKPFRYVGVTVTCTGRTDGDGTTCEKGARAKESDERRRGARGCRDVCVRGREQRTFRYAPHTRATWFASIGIGTTRSVASATISPDVAHTSHFWFSGE